MPFRSRIQKTSFQRLERDLERFQRVKEGRHWVLLGFT